MVDVIFAVNDPLKGPNIVLYETTEEKDPNLTLKVPVKAQLTLSLMDKDANVNMADAVLPFPDLKKTSFSFLFTMKSESNVITGSISYLVPQSDNTNLYKKIPELKEKLTFIAKQLQSWNYKSESTLPKNFFDLITGMLIYETDGTYKAGNIDNMVTTENSSGAPDYLFKKINKNLDHLFFDLYVGRPVVVIGKSKISVEYAMATMDFLTPTKTLRKVVFSEEFIDPLYFEGKVDVFGTSSIHEKRLKDCLIVDVDKFEIKGIKGKRTYFKNFMDEMVQIDVLLAGQNIKKFVERFDYLVSQLENLTKQPDFSDDRLRTFLKTLTYDEATTLMDIYNIKFPKKSITQQFSTRLTSLLDDIR